MITLQCIQILTHFVHLTYNTFSQLYLNLKKRIYRRKVSKMEPHLVDAKEMNKLSFVSLARPLSLTAHPHTLLVSPLGHLHLMSLRHLWVLMAKTSFSCLLSLLSPGSIQVQFSSVAQSCLTLCEPMNRSTPGLAVHHQLPEFTQIHVCWVSDAIQPSHSLSAPSPPALNPSQHQSVFQWMNSSHEVAKVLEFQL